MWKFTQQKISINGKLHTDRLVYWISKKLQLNVATYIKSQNETYSRKIHCHLNTFKIKVWYKTGWAFSNESNVAINCMRNAWLNCMVGESATSKNFHALNSQEDNCRQLYKLSNSIRKPSPCCNPIYSSSILWAWATYEKSLASVPGSHWTSWKFPEHDAVPFSSSTTTYSWSNHVHPTQNHSNTAQKSIYLFHLNHCKEIKFSNAAKV